MYYYKFIIIMYYYKFIAFQSYPTFNSFIFNYRKNIEY
jgi:hypothetical protein